MTVVVCDTTPLNYLILVGEVDVLPRLFGKLIVPAAVIAEMRHAKTPPSVSAWAQSPPQWAEIRMPQRDLGLRMGKGENQAIALALETRDAVLLVDDRKARGEAEARGIVSVGTLAILDIADEAGLLDFETTVAHLLSTSFHLEASVLDSILAKVRKRKQP